MQKNKHSCRVLGEFKLYGQYYKAFGRIYSELKQSSCPLTQCFFFLEEKSETSMNIYAQNTLIATLFINSKNVGMECEPKPVK